ncbi:MAG: hypothetical protein U5Q16_09930 [Gammaproteobacteria bacterium]|nr:hypothetical protein [Gammaproteobacteria bacterium]
MAQGEISARPFWAARNWSADAGAGSIHDDATATRLGFRGGTVAGSVHMDQCAALLVEEYGKRWFEQGALSLYFRNATTDGERVQAVCEVPHGASQVSVWLRREDDLEVAAGTASLGEHGATALRTRDLRPVEPQALRILKGLVPGAGIGEWHETLAAPGDCPAALCGRCASQATRRAEVRRGLAVGRPHSRTVHGGGVTLGCAHARPGRLAGRSRRPVRGYRGSPSRRAADARRDLSSHGRGGGVE